MQNLKFKIIRKLQSGYSLFNHRVNQIMFKFKHSLGLLGDLSIVDNCSVYLGKGSSITNNGFFHLHGNLTASTNCSIIISTNATLEIGKDVAFNQNCYIAAKSSIYIGDNSIFGPNTVLVDHDHDFRCSGGLKALNYHSTRVYIGSNVWIGANTVILRGSYIEDNSIIAAGSIVKGHIPPNVVFHNEAKPIISSIKQ